MCGGITSWPRSITDHSTSANCATSQFPAYPKLGYAQQTTVPEYAAQGHGGVLRFEALRWHQPSANSHAAAMVRFRFEPQITRQTRPTILHTREEQGLRRWQKRFATSRTYLPQDMGGGGGQHYNRTGILPWACSNLPQQLPFFSLGGGDTDLPGIIASYNNSTDSNKPTLRPQQPRNLKQHCNNRNGTTNKPWSKLHIAECVYI